ncbi:MAG: hypothetical protein NTW19_01685 [Planctomycetota bacterium]|nr:hypothetical protein [Planctomycetota bacterium]
MIFLDTSALVALHVQKEAGHAAVAAAWSVIAKRGGMSTSNLVMA